MFSVSPQILGLAFDFCKGRSVAFVLVLLFTFVFGVAALLRSGMLSNVFTNSGENSSLPTRVAFFYLAICFLANSNLVGSFFISFNS